MLDLAVVLASSSLSLFSNVATFVPCTLTMPKDTRRPLEHVCRRPLAMDGGDIAGEFLDALKSLNGTLKLSELLNVSDRCAEAAASSTMMLPSHSHSAERQLRCLAKHY